MNRWAIKSIAFSKVRDIMIKLTHGPSDLMRVTRETPKISGEGE